MQAALHVRNLFIKKGERETVWIMCSVCPFLYVAEGLSNSLYCVGEWSMADYSLINVLIYC